MDTGVWNPPASKGLYFRSLQVSCAKTEMGKRQECNKGFDIEFPGTNGHKSCSRKSICKLNLSMHTGSQRELNKWECESGFVFVFWIFFFPQYIMLYTQNMPRLWLCHRLDLQEFSWWDYSSQKFQTAQAVLGSYWLWLEENAQKLFWVILR